MYLEHFSLNERPFSISPDPRFLFMSNRYREALAHLTYGVEDGGGFVLLTGEVGTGKTTVCRCLLQQLPEKTRLAFVLNPKLNSLELLATICDELGIDYPENCSSLKILTDRLSDYLLECYEQGLSVVVMIDEAQNIDTEVLEQIRLLTNLETNQKKLLQIILVGQPELQEKLAQRDLRQLAQRITARYHLRPLNLKETIAYVLHRIRIAGAKKSIFSRSAVELLHQKTQGIPRLINTICDRALVAAASRNKLSVNEKIMQEAIADVVGAPDFESPIETSNQLLKNLLIGAAILFTLGFVYWLGQQSATPDKPSIAIAKKQPLAEDSSATEVNATSRQEVETSVPKATQRDKPLIERMLADQRWDNKGHWSMVNLLALWQISYSPLNDGKACHFAASYGLGCHRVVGNWQQLREFNRPAILKFSAGLQGEFWGTLIRLKGNKADLQFGDRKVSFALDELSTLWTGEYQMLWQAPPGYQGDILLGQRGEAVSWLSEKLKKLLNPTLPLSDYFDQALLANLKQYQKQRNIQADGIAGIQTILTINGETLEGIPQLFE